MREGMLPKASITNKNGSTNKIMPVHVILFTDILLIGKNQSKITTSSNVVGKFKYKMHFNLPTSKLIEDSNETDSSSKFSLEDNEKSRMITLFFPNKSTKLLWHREVSQTASKIESPPVKEKVTTRSHTRKKSLLESFKMSGEIDLKSFNGNNNNNPISPRNNALSTSGDSVNEDHKNSIRQLEETLSLSKNQISQLTSDLEQTREILCTFFIFFFCFLIYIFHHQCKLK